MRGTYRILFLLTLALLATLGLALVQVPPEGATGAPHPEFASLNRGGDFDRHAGRLVLGWIYGALQIGIFVVCFWVGVGERRSWRGWIPVCGVAYLGTFTALMVTYGQGVAEAPLFLGFPLPTTLLVFGMWPVAALFAILYVIRYRQWIYSAEDAVKVAELKARFAKEERDRHDA